MTIREQIIQQLDYYEASWCPEYNKLKSCLKHFIQTDMFKEVVDDEYSQLLDLWFEGVIKSLFYQPNHYLLVLEGEDEFENMKFFMNLLPNTLWYSNQNKLHGQSIYSELITFVEFEYQKQQKILEEDNFIVYEENARALIHPGTDKRLCSYCTTTNKWRYPQRKNVIVLSLESIDWELYNSIDKLELWKEIFFKFKPKSI